MNLIRKKAILNYLNKKYNPTGWSINETKDTVNDNKLNKKHPYFVLSQHFQSMIVLVVELDDSEQQQSADFYINHIKSYCNINATILGTIVYLAFNKDNLIVQDITTEIS